MIPECRAFAARGYRAVSLEYPLANLPAARAYAFVAADHYRAGGRVYALGSSSGGTLAVLLALEGRVDGAVAAGPMVDLLHEPSCANFWTRDFCHKLRRVADTRTRRRLSPAFVRPHHAAPLVLVQDPHDIVIDFRKTAAFARRYHLPLIRSDQGHAWSVRIELRAFDLMLGLKA